MRSDVGWNLECDEGLDKLFGAEAKRRDNHGSQVALLRALVLILEKPRRFSDGKSYERAGAWQKEMTPLFQREMGCGVLRDV